MAVEIATTINKQNGSHLDSRRYRIVSKSFDNPWKPLPLCCNLSPPPPPPPPLPFTFTFSANFLSKLRIEFSKKKKKAKALKSKKKGTGLNLIGWVWRCYWRKSCNRWRCGWAFWGGRRRSSTWTRISTRFCWFRVSPVRSWKRLIPVTVRRSGFGFGFSEPITSAAPSFGLASIPLLVTIYNPFFKFVYLCA